MAQPTITNFFPKRKRTNGSDIVSSAKVLLLERDETSLKGKTTLEVGGDHKLVYNCVIPASKGKDFKLAPSSRTVNTKTNSKTTIRKAAGAAASKTSTTLRTQNLPDIRVALVKKSVLFELKGSLSPKKQNVAAEELTSENHPTKAETITAAGLKEPLLDSGEVVSNFNSNASSEISNILSTSISLHQVENTSKKQGLGLKCSKTDLTSTTMARKELGLMSPKKRSDANKELSLQDIKLRISRSTKLAELRESLAKINKTQDKLKDINQRKNQLAGCAPKLGKFDTIALEVRSPMKDLRSPVKKLSPVSSPLKAPAYQQYASLAVAGTPTLVLPYKHRCLIEVFRCVDTVVAMLHNRQETITFKKLKPAVQQMLRRNFTENHLGQIKRVLPSAFLFEQSKLHSFGMAAKADKYELKITPLIDEIVERDDGRQSEAPPLTPSVLLQRRKKFSDNLVERVKDQHDEFLQGLDLPLTIKRDKLARWHPEFELEDVAEIEPEELPEPPNTERYCTATDVLAKAKSLFSCNQRMENALRKVSELSMMNAANESTKTAPRTPTKSPAIVSALKGIPKALLEKVRANQAAKAMMVMSRSAADTKTGVQHSRLPELARILRNLYVAEKKNVLPMEVALNKMGDSFREKLSDEDLEQHVELIMQSVPGWLEVHILRKTKYLKISKTADMTQVMARLQSLSVEKNLA